MRRWPRRIRITPRSCWCARRSLPTCPHWSNSPAASIPLNGVTRRKCCVPSRPISRKASSWSSTRASSSAIAPRSASTRRRHSRRIRGCRSPAAAWVRAIAATATGCTAWKWWCTRTTATSASASACTRHASDCAPTSSCAASCSAAVSPGLRATCSAMAPPRPMCRRWWTASAAIPR